MKKCDKLPDALLTFPNMAMRIEREIFLHANPYQRTEERTDYANEFKPRTIQTRLGDLHFEIPQTRKGGFYPSCLERGLRSERALNAAMAEMYIHGVSTREVNAVLEKMCGLEVSAIREP